MSTSSENLDIVLYALLKHVPPLNVYIFGVCCGCKKYAKLYAIAVSTLGTSAYTTAQKEVCKCCE